ncbi:MAG TPA: tetratricopeptide repeat protein [Methylococcus sp.]|nr:tetratricopeptide repeat protein [Methylococcus sp.]
MDIYLTEEERLEALKRWWKENGRAVILGIGLGLAIIAGWGIWKRTQTEKAEQASALYQQLLRAVEEKRTDAAVSLGERLTKSYPGSSYAVYAKLFLARLRVEANDLATAKNLLQEVIAEANEEGIRHIARLRLGQVLLAAGQAEEALSLVKTAEANGFGEFAGLYAELQGDLYQALNRGEDARSAYLKAQQEGHASPLLELKLSEPVTAPATPSASAADTSAATAGPGANSAR